MGASTFQENFASAGATREAFATNEDPGAGTGTASGEAATGPAPPPPTAGNRRDKRSDQEKFPVLSHSIHVFS